MLLEGATAFADWYRRGVQAGAREDPNVRFVATANEMNAIRDVMEYVEAITEDKVGNAPWRAVRYYQGMLAITSCKDGVAALSSAQVHKVIDNGILPRDEDYERY